MAKSRHITRLNRGFTLIELLMTIIIIVILVALLSVAVNNDEKGNALHVVDVTAFSRAFEQDGNFSLEQLNRLSDNAPKAIAAFLEQWPHAINSRDPKTKDTVLHHCARTGNPTRRLPTPSSTRTVGGEASGRS